MSTENEKWQEKPEEGASHAGREGMNRFRNSYNEGGREENSERNYGQPQYDRPRRSFGDRPQRSFGDRPQRSFHRDGEERPFGDRPRRSFHNDGEERPFGDRPRRSFHNDGEERPFGERPRRSFGDREQRPFGDRPRRSFNNDGEGRSFGDRPRRSFNRDGESRPFGDRPQRSFGDRPQRSFHRDGEERPFGERPHRKFSNDSEGRSFGDRPQRSFRRDGEERPFGDRPRRDFGERQGFSRPRPRFTEEPDKVRGTREDGRPFRPRVSKSRSSNPEWLAENDFKAPKYAPNIDPTQPIRLNKFLSNAGICSRREADEFIQAGVVKVNGETVCELGVKVMPNDEIMFHDQPVKIEKKVYILLNKPKDCVTTSEDPQERLTVMDLVKDACYERIYPVGRLDRNTTGVLLLTNDGDLASKLAHPKFEKRKIYQATLDHDVTEEDLKSISEGVELDGEHVAVDEISYVKEQKNVIGIEIHSGQNRVVRRIFEQYNYKVIKLDRVYFAGLTKKDLPRGKWRHLSEREVGLLKMGVFA